MEKGRILWKNVFKLLFRTGVVFYIMLMFLAGCASNKMIFYPPSPGYRENAPTVTIKVNEKESIRAFHSKLPSPAKVILYSHGNAEDIGYGSYLLNQARQHGFSMLSYDYRGYGLSDGKATVDNCYEDIEAAYNYLIKSGHKEEDIIIYGRSVGSGPSTWLATQKKAGALVLESPFMSCFRVVTRWKILPFDRFDNYAIIRDIKCPLLIFHGKKDRVIPFYHGKKLYEKATAPKEFYPVENAGHNNMNYLVGELIWRKVKDFVDTAEK